MQSYWCAEMCDLQMWNLRSRKEVGGSTAAGKLLWQMCDVIWVPLSAAHNTCVFCKCEIWYLIYQGRRVADVTNVRLERVLYLTIQIWFWSCSMFVCYSHKYVIRKCEIWDQGRKRQAVCRESWCDESEIRCPPSVSYALPLFLTISTLQQIFSSTFLSVQTFI